MDVEQGNLYDFGYGLSFTSYEYSDVTLSSETAKAGEVLTVSVDVTNTGDMDGYETGMWIAMDYAHVIVHIFHKNERDFYKLEKLYGDAEEIIFEGIDDKFGGTEQ